MLHHHFHIIAYALEYVKDILRFTNISLLDVCKTRCYSWIFITNHRKNEMTFEEELDKAEAVLKALEQQRKLYALINSVDDREATKSPPLQLLGTINTRSRFYVMGGKIAHMISDKGEDC